MKPGLEGIGAIVGLVLLGLPLSIITAFTTMGSSWADAGFFGWGGAVIIGGGIGLFAKRPAKIFRYTFLFGAVAFLLMPVATIRAGLGLVSIVFSTYMAAAYLIVGLLIGRDKTAVAAPIPETPAQFPRDAPAVESQKDIDEA